MPDSAQRLLTALGAEGTGLESARLGAGAGGATIRELGQLFPKVEAPAPSAA